MPITTIITGAQKRTKDSFASSPPVGLALRSNGEETVKVIDARGNVFLAGLQVPAVAPTVANPSVGAGLLFPFFYAYVYVYASSKFPFVESDGAINGKLFPRSNPSLSGTHAVATSAPNAQILVTVTKTTNTAITTIWVFRTAAFATAAEATTAAAGGFAFFNKELVNDGVAGTINYTDSNPVDGTDQVQNDNFVAPQFQFCVYADPYWWGFGNLPFTAAVSWTAVGLVTLTGGDTWFNGRDRQNVTFSGITTGGIDGNGTYLFKNLTTTTANVTLDGTTSVGLPTTASGTITIQGPATTLFRSKPRNPFSWGFTETIGSSNVPQQYAFKVGGGMEIGRAHV